MDIAIDVQPQTSTIRPVLHNAYFSDPTDTGTPNDPRYGKFSFVVTDPTNKDYHGHRYNEDGSRHNGDYTYDPANSPDHLNEGFDRLSADNDSKPIILDLDGDGIEVTIGQNTLFDLDEDGYLEQTSWASSDDGFLVVDLGASGELANPDGVIDQARELVFSEWANVDLTDLEALATVVDGNGDKIFDSNNDGLLTVGDTSWLSFRVWQDLNQDGVADLGELRSLHDWGISQINLTYDDAVPYGDEQDSISVFGSKLFGAASYTMDGLTTT